jgi:TRAP transporter T-component
MKLVLALAALLVTASCSGFINKQAADSTYRILSQSQVVGRRQFDLELARAAVPGGIFQLEAFALAYPDHRGFKLLHAESLCQYAVGFVFDDWEDAQLRGRAEEAAALEARVTRLVTACAEANLALAPPAWRQARSEGRSAWRAMIEKASREHVSQLLWIATSDAVLLAMAPLRNLPKVDSITAALQRCIALHPGFHDSDAELLLGTLEAGASRFLGGADGSARFTQARASLGEGALIIDVMYARGTLVAKQDRARFEATLRQVLAADVTKWPERRLANELARKKAERYLAAIDQLIAPPSPRAPSAEPDARAPAAGASLNP